MFDWISISFCKKDLCCFLNWCILPRLFTMIKTGFIIYLHSLITGSYKYYAIKCMKNDIFNLILIISYKQYTSIVRCLWIRLMSSDYKIVNKSNSEKPEFPIRCVHDLHILYLPLQYSSVKNPYVLSCFELL